jgi:hypothetical protein
VLSWEKGKFKSKGKKKTVLVALRKVRKRDVKKMLPEKAPEKGRKDNPRNKGKMRKKNR